MTGLFDKYWGVLRRLKINYVIYNFFHQGKLKHNRELYKRYGINKPVYFPVSSRDFEHLPQQRTWLEHADGLQKMKNHPEFSQFPKEIQTAMETWVEGGYVILKKYFSKDKVNACNTEVDRLMNDGSIDFNYGGKKIMFAYQKGKELNGIANDQLLKSMLSFLLGSSVSPFQSINFIKSSEQRAHSDFIHMATYPLGHLAATWVAFEDIGKNQGPLFYIPGSHKLPYVLNGNYDHGGSELLLGKEAYLAYEETIQRLIREKGLEKIAFFPEQGDVFIWHGNLIHGALKMEDKQLTRKSMVVHYFTEDAICYHELTQRPALMNN